MALEKDANGDFYVDSESKVKYIPDSQLMELKVGLETKLGALEKEIAESKNTTDSHKSAYDNKHQETLQLQARIDELTNNQQGTAATAAELEKLKADMVTMNGHLDLAKTELTETKRKSLTSLYGVEPTKLAEQTLEQLTELEKAIDIFGITGKVVSPIDGGGGGGPVEGPKDSTSKIRQGWSEKHPDQ